MDGMGGMERWRGKVAVVTGASAGIGAAIATEFCRHGMKVVGLARRVQKIEELADSLKGLPGEVQALECDVRSEESVVASFNWIRENMGGKINVLVNNAGVTKESSLIDGALEDWREVFNVNCLGLCLCTREAIRLMKESSKSEGEERLVIHINSYAGERVPSVPGFSIYPASKRAVTGLAQSLRHELLGTDIRVTSISPGLVATDLMASYSTFSEEIMAAMPTLGPEDVAAAAIFVLSTPSHVLVQDIVLRPLGETW